MKHGWEHEEWVAEMNKTELAIHIHLNFGQRWSSTVNEAFGGAAYIQGLIAM